MLQGVWVHVPSNKYGHVLYSNLLYKDDQLQCSHVTTFLDCHCSDLAKAHQMCAVQMFASTPLHNTV